MSRKPTPEEQFRKFDHDGDGYPGGSLPRAKRNEPQKGDTSMADNDKPRAGSDDANTRGAKPSPDEKTGAHADKTEAAPEATGPDPADARMATSGAGPTLVVSARVNNGDERHGFEILVGGISYLQDDNKAGEIEVDWDAEVTIRPVRRPGEADEDIQNPGNPANDTRTAEERFQGMTYEEARARDKQEREQNRHRPKAEEERK